MSFEDPANLEFRRRADLRPRRMKPSSSQSVWLVIAIIAAIVLVLFVRAMLERSAWTAGHSSDFAETAMTDVPSDGELDVEPWPASPPRNGADQQNGTEPVQTPPVSMVYRCVSKGGAVSLQSHPCADGEKTTRVIHAPPDVEGRGRVALYSPPRPSAQPYVFSTSSDDERSLRRAKCESAKRHRQQTLELVGLARTYDLLQKLDEQVYEACKGL